MENKDGILNVTQPQNGSVPPQQPPQGQNTSGVGSEQGLPQIAPEMAPVSPEGQNLGNFSVNVDPNQTVMQGATAEMHPTAVQMAHEAVNEATAGAVTHDGTPVTATSSLRPETMQSKKVTKSIKLHVDGSEKKSHVGLIIVAILTVLLAVGAFAAWYIWGDELFGGEKVQEPGNSEVEEEEKTENEEVGELTEVDINSELVQGVYGNFDKISWGYDDAWNYYIDPSVRAGNTNKELAVLIVRYLNTYTNCASVHNIISDDGLRTEVPATECLSGDLVRSELNRIFGQEIVFEDGWATEHDFCGQFVYDATSDEFYLDALGCGGQIVASVLRSLERAETNGQYLYLYERALFYGMNDAGNFDLRHIGTENIRDGELIGEYAAETDSAEVIDTIVREQGDVFKWTFKKMDDGRYVFVSLAPVGE